MAYINTSSWQGRPAGIEVLIDNFGYLASRQSMLVNPEFLSAHEETYRFIHEDGGVSEVEILVFRFNFGSEEELIIDVPWTGGPDDTSNQYAYVGCYNPFDMEAPPEAQESAIADSWYPEDVRALADRLVPGARYPVLVADYALV